VAAAVTREIADQSRIVFAILRRRSTSNCNYRRFSSGSQRSPLLVSDPKKRKNVTAITAIGSEPI
jgi:hypothetical protein